MSCWNGRENESAIRCSLSWRLQLRQPHCKRWILQIPRKYTSRQPLLHESAAVRMRLAWLGLALQCSATTHGSTVAQPRNQHVLGQLLIDGVACEPGMKEPPNRFLLAHYRQNTPRHMSSLNISSWMYRNQVTRQRRQHKVRLAWDPFPLGRVPAPVYASTLAAFMVYGRPLLAATALVH